MATLKQELLREIKKREKSKFEFYLESRISRVVFERFMKGLYIKPMSRERIVKWIEGKHGIDSPFT